MNSLNFTKKIIPIEIELGGIQSPTMNTAQKITKALGVGLEDLTK